MQLSIGIQQSVIKISFDISLLLCLCLAPTQEWFGFSPTARKKKRSSQARGFTTFCFDAYISLRRLQKTKKKKPSVVIYPVCSSSPSLRVSLGVLCDCLWVHIYTEIGRGVVTA